MQTNEDSPLGKRIRALFGNRINSEIARELGVHPSTVHTIMVTGTATDKMLKRIAEKTGCDVAWIICGLNTSHLHDVHVCTSYVCMCNLDRAGLERRVIGALRATINAHGPITNNLMLSATKRIIGGLKEKAD